jgi:hypothetical protein
MKFTKTNDINGTHLQGNVGATYQELVQVFGEPKSMSQTEQHT